MKGWLGEYKARHIVWLATHPLIAGKVNLTYQETLTKIVTRPFHVTFTLDRKDFNTEERVEKSHNTMRTYGWKLGDATKISSTIPDTVRSVIIHPSGADIEITLCLPKGHDTNSADVEFVESKKQTERKEKRSSFELAWGKSIDIPSPFFSLQYQSFDGKTYDLSHTNNDNPYLNFENIHYKAFKVKAVPPNE